MRFPIQYGLQKLGIYPEIAAPVAHILGNREEELLDSSEIIKEKFLGISFGNQIKNLKV